MGPSALAYGHYTPGRGAEEGHKADENLSCADMATTVLGLQGGAGLHNVSSHFFAEPIPQVVIEEVLGTQALEWC